MKTKLPGTAIALAVVLTAVVGDAADVVGLRTAHEDFFVAVRGVVPEGTVVTGVTFHSNDATVFPEVRLAADAGDRRLPAVGTTLRSVENVTGRAGSVTVTFPAYTVPADQYLWAIVRFPDNEPIEAEGVGGGPGIGKRAQPVLVGERSLFSVEGSMNEFSGFDISLVTGPATGKAVPQEPPSEALPSVLTVEISPSQAHPGAVFAMSLPHAARVVVDVYDVTGRRVARVIDHRYPAGRHELLWNGLDDSRRRTSTGVYLYRVMADDQTRTGKVVLIR